MSAFVDTTAASITGPLLSAHFPFPRSKELFQLLAQCVTDYYTKANLHQPFEARGLMITGKSRVGKSREINRVIRLFNDDNVIMPNGRPGKIIQVRLNGRVTWKGLGLATLKELGYPLQAKRTQYEIWEKVLFQAKHLNVIGIHYDEAQHIFHNIRSAETSVVLDSFKALLKDTSWPMMLFWSGPPELAQHIESDAPDEERRQLRYLLKTLHFPLIHIDQDIETIQEICYAYADKAQVSIDEICTEQFIRRIAHACAYRWGLLIELLIQALTECRLEDCSNLKIKHLDAAFAHHYRLRPGYSPFTHPDYINAFDPETMMSTLQLGS